MKKLTLFLTLTLLLTAALALTTTFAEEDSLQWLPEGAIARLGKGAVYDIKFSADGTRLIVASGPGVRHYDARTGEEVDMILWDMRIYPRGQAALSPDGTIFAFGTPFGNGHIVLLDAHTGEFVKILEDHTEDIWSVAFSPDGKTLASGSYDTTIRLWDVATGKTLNTLTGHTKTVTNVAFSPDGKILASGSSDTTIRLWDVATGETRHTLSNPDYYVNSVAFSPDGKILASNYGDTIRLWDVAAGEIRHTLTDTGSARNITFSPDGKTLTWTSASGDATVRLWDVATGEIRHTLTDTHFYNFAFSPDGKTLVGSSRAEIHLWDVATGETRHTLTGPISLTSFVAFSPDGKALAAKGGSTIWLWDVATGEIRHTLPDTDFANSVAFSPDGKTLVSGGQGTIRLWDVAAGEIRHTLTDATPYDANSVAFSPDGKTLASVKYRDSIRLWDVVTGEIRHTLTDTDSVARLAFSPDGTILASGGRYSWDDKTIRLWDVRTGHLRATLTGHTKTPSGFVFSPDGSTLISTSGDGTIRVWDVRSGKQVKVLGVPCTATSGPAISPDSRFIAVGDGFGNISLIDIVADKFIDSFPGHVMRNAFVAINPDGSILASASRDGTVILWDLTPFTSTEQPPPEQSDSVRVVYFQPSDRDAFPGIDANLRTLVTDVQQFYAEQMQAHGYGEKTVAFETDTSGNVIVRHFTGEFTDAYYQDQTYDKVQKEISDYFYQSKHVYLVAIDISSEVINDDGTCGVGGGRWWNRFEGEAWHRDLGGLAVIPASGDCFNVGVTAHELGHAMGLDHDFRDDSYLMAYGSQQRLSREAAAWLDASRLFNPSQPDLGQQAAIEVLSNRAAQLRFQVTDGDGLHQAQLLIPTTPDDPAQGTKLHRSQALNGKESLTIAFSSVPVVSGQEVTLQVIDVHGNIAKQTFSIGTTGGVQVVGDINGDGVVNIQDLVLVANAFGQTGQQAADVNGDGIVNIQDLVKVAGAIGGDAAAPSVMPAALDLFSTADVQQWLVETNRLSLTDALSQRGVRFLEQLLAALTPTETALLPNYPNPFNPETWLPYQLAESAAVTVRIYAANGSLVRMLALGLQPAGIYEGRSRAAYWDGRNAQGEPVASGVYFYTLQAGEFSATRKMVIRK